MHLYWNNAFKSLLSCWTVDIIILSEQVHNSVYTTLLCLIHVLILGVCMCIYLILDKLVINKDVKHCQSSILTYSSSTWIYLSFSCGENFWPCENSKNTQKQLVVCERVSHKLMMIHVILPLKAKINCQASYCQKFL